jgi:hypothetical protein
MNSRELDATPPAAAIADAPTPLPSAFKQTPGPWRRRTGGTYYNTIEAQSGRSRGRLDDGWRPIASGQSCGPLDVSDAEERANCEANLNLIAAAPELLDACIAQGRCTLLLNQTTGREGRWTM